MQACTCMQVCVHAHAQALWAHAGACAHTHMHVHLHVDNSAVGCTRQYLTLWVKYWHVQTTSLYRHHSHIMMHT